MRYFLGIDIGGSKSHALIADEHGRAVGFGAAGGGNHEVVGWDGLRDSLCATKTAALASADICAAEVAAIGLGISGYDWPSQSEPTREAVRALDLEVPCEFVNDAEIGLIAGAREGWGIVVAAGSGNNCRGRDQQGRRGRITGNGALMGEFGGAGEMVQRAIQTVAYAWTGRGPATRLTDMLLSHCGTANIEELLEGLALQRYELPPRLALQIIELACDGDAVAIDTVRWAGSELGHSALAVIRQLGICDSAFEVVLAGNLFHNNPMLTQAVRETIQRVAPGATLVRLTAPPVVGAVLLAMKQIGLETATLRQNLIASTEALLEHRGSVAKAQRPATLRLPSNAVANLACLGRGVNLGNMLEAPVEGEMGLAVEAEFFPLIRSAGFTHVRVPICWSSHAETQAPYGIDPAFFRRIDWVIDQALSNDLAIVINVHHYRELFANPTAHAERLVALWTQIAKRYADRPHEVFFELLNEPQDALDSRLWNRMLLSALSGVRASNPTRGVIIGPVEWNAYTRLRELELPAGDQNLIATFHYYLPFEFTHQGAEWVADTHSWVGRTWDGDGAAVSAIEEHLDLALKWSAERDRPLYLGEFGAYYKADMDSRARWTAQVARAAEGRGIGWAYWEFASGFGVYDPTTRTWRDPLLRALGVHGQVDAVGKPPGVT